MDAWRDYKMDFLSPGRSGRFRLEHFEIPPGPTHHDVSGRPTGLGRFVRLVEESASGVRVWMTDTRAEILEHEPLFAALDQVREPASAGSGVLVSGLGLGLAVVGAVRHGATWVDVVERQPEVVDLVGAQVVAWAAKRGVQVNVHVQDVFDFVPSPGVSYDAAWHDIWPTISDENLPEMDALEARFASHVRGPSLCWARDRCELMGSVIGKLSRGQELTFEEWMFAARSASGVWARRQG